MLKVGMKYEMIHHMHPGNFRQVDEWGNKVKLSISAFNVFGGSGIARVDEEIFSSRVFY